MFKKYRKIIFLLSLAVVVLLSQGCKKNQENSAQINDGSYVYSNKMLGFSVNLPKEFIYYQTQRIETEDYQDIEIFVPTSDTSYPQQVPGYAKPVVIRVYQESVWEGLPETEKEKNQKLGEKNNKIYLIKFWGKSPEDWKEKWTTEMERGITDSFNLY